MDTIAPVDWTPRQTELWRRIALHAFERPDQALDFTRRLARDHDWSLAFARGAVEEYRRFCFLAMTGTAPVTPSEDVDEVWHQHLTYSRDYWEDWCGRALGAALHHDPTGGGPAEAARYRTHYAETLALYEGHFGAPDPVYWPATHRRFQARPRYRVVDRDRTLILRRPSWRGSRASSWSGRLALAAATGVGLLAPDAAHALPLSPFDWPATPFLTLYGVLIGVALTLVLVTRASLRGWGSGGYAGPWAQAAATDLDLLHLAWLGGGRQRASDLVLAGLVEAGAARVLPWRPSVGAMRLPEIAIDDRGVVLPEPFAAFRGLAQGGLTHASFTRAVAPGLARVENDLARRGLTPPQRRIVQARVLIAALVGLVVAFGAIKIAVGTLRDKPVGYLVVMTFAIVIAAGIVASSTPTRTRLGQAVLRFYRERHARAAAAPRGHELLFAFAMSGAAVLTGTHLGDLGRLILPRKGGGSGAGDGGSGGDGSGCGGGCGGCGGGGGD